MAGRHYILRPFITSGKMMTSARMTSSQVEALQVVHDEDNKEFYIQLGGDKAYLLYDVVDPGKKIVDLQHTVVPEAFRGQHIGKVLAKAALDHFVASNQQMKLTCWYLKKYFQENPLPEYQDKILDKL